MANHIRTIRIHIITQPIVLTRSGFRPAARQTGDVLSQSNPGAGDWELADAQTDENRIQTQTHTHEYTRNGTARENQPTNQQRIDCTIQWSHTNVTHEHTRTRMTQLHKHSHARTRPNTHRVLAKSAPSAVIAIETPTREEMCSATATVRERER